MLTDDPRMNYQKYLDSLTQPAPPVDIEVALRALWYDANDKPESAMRAAEFDGNHACLRVRAYLFRKMGDANKAQLWYWRAGAKAWQGSSESEWKDIVMSVLSERPVANAYS